MEQDYRYVQLEQVFIEDELAQVVEDLRASQSTDKLPEGIARALDYIHGHLFSESLDAKEVREGCGLHNNNIASRFKRHIGLGMRGYIEQGRMEAAKRLLHNPDLGILQIAWAVGYAYPESFARAFKRYTGSSATHFRDRYLRTKVKTAREECSTLAS